MAFSSRRINSTPVHIDRENIGQVTNSRGLKNALSSGRKHFGPKQVFGELKNVIHNQQNLTTPLKPNLSSTTKATPFKSVTNIKTDSKTVSKAPSTSSRVTITKKEKSEIPKKIKGFIENPTSDDPMCLWAQKIVLTDDEINRIINGHDDELPLPQPKPTAQLFPHFWNNASQQNVDLFSLGTFERDQIVPINTPELPDINSDEELFDELLAF